MQRLIAMSGLLLIFLAGCRFTPDWTALYEAKTGQSMTDLNEAALNNPYSGERETLTRVSWAKFEHDGFVLLGLPAHNNSPQDVVDRTVILTEEEWQGHCEWEIEQISETEVYGWSWSNEDAVGNTFKAHPLLPLSDRYPPYCEFVFLPGRWELRVVERQKINGITSRKKTLVVTGAAADWY